MPTTGSSDATDPSSCSPGAAPGASRRAAVIAAAYTALVGLFPSRQLELDSSYAASLAALARTARNRHVGTLGARVSAPTRGNRASAVSRGARRSRKQCSRGVRPMASTPATLPSAEGTAVGQWRPVAPATAMSAQGLAFTAHVRPGCNTQFRPPAPRALDSATYVDDFNAVKALGRRHGSTRTEEQTALAPFWEGNASVHWNQAANQIARAHRLSISSTNRLLAVLNIAMADTALTIWSAKRFYGEDAAQVTWRPITAITLADTDGNPARFPTSTGNLSSLRRPTRNILPDIPVSTGRPRAFFSLTSATDKHLRSRRPDSRTARTPASGRRAPTVTTRECGAACTIRARSQSAMRLAERSRAT